MLAAIDPFSRNTARMDKKNWAAWIFDPIWGFCGKMDQWFWGKFFADRDIGLLDSGKTWCRTVFCNKKPLVMFLMQCISDAYWKIRSEQCFGLIQIRKKPLKWITSHRLRPLQKNQKPAVWSAGLNDYLISFDLILAALPVLSRM